MTDFWDDQHIRVNPAVASGSTTGKPKISKTIVVPDDWELDEEEEEEDAGLSVDLRNKQLWEDANAVRHPMPSLIISRGTSSTSVALPSLPLNQPPPMRILKRPSPSSLSPTASTNSGSATGETLEEREARYYAARERIFANHPEDMEQPTRASLSVELVREPRGPDGSNFDTKGFGERKAKQRPATAIS